MTEAVALVAHSIVDGLPWAAAFTLGVIVSSTDPVAATVIFRRFGVLRWLVVITEGELLMNESTALIVFRVAVVATVSGTFSLRGATTSFVFSVVGGIAIGLAIAWLIIEVRRRIEDPPVVITTPPDRIRGFPHRAGAGRLRGPRDRGSGAVCGVACTRHRVGSSRVSGFAVGDFVFYIVNAVLFVLIGFQLRAIVEDLADLPISTILALGAAVIATVVGARFVWMFTTPYLVRALDRRPSRLHDAQMHECVSSVPGLACAGP